MNSVLHFSLLLLSISISINALKVEGFTIDTDLKKSQFPDMYDFPSKVMINLSDNKDLCPSGQCEIMMDGKSTFLLFSLNEAGHYMDMSGDVRLKDDITNGNLTPKKQNLVEQIHLGFQCSFTDIIEEKGMTKYICNGDTGIVMRNYNSTTFSYPFSASFELPSMHYSLNATS